MKIIRVVIMVVAFLLPILVRGLWFYQGNYQRATPVSTPDYASFALPQPPISAVAPASTTDNAAEKTAAEAVVLLDVYHSNVFKLSEIDPLNQALHEFGGRFENYDGTQDLESQLKRAASMVVILPTEPFSPTEIQSLERFVKQGGHLLVISDPTRSSFYEEYSGATFNSAQVVNEVLSPFEMTFREDYAYNLSKYEGNFRNLLLTEIAENSLTDGVHEMALYGAQTLLTNQTPVLVGDANVLSSLDDRGNALVLAALSQDERVLALGDLSFMASTYIEVADNRQFTRNIAKFLTAGSNPPSLANFPVVFARPVALLFDEKQSISASMVAVTGTLQTTLQRGYDLPVMLTSKAPKGYDLVLTGTFDKLDEKILVPYLKEYKLKYAEEQPEDPFLDFESSYQEMEATPAPDASSQSVGGIAPLATEENWWESSAYGGYGGGSEMIGSVLIPGLGKFKTEGLGVILYTPGEEQNVMVLLSDTEENLVLLAQLVSAGDISGCLKTEQIAVCSVGY